MLVSAECPVAVLSAMFCIVCSLVVCVGLIMGPYMVAPYSSMGRVKVL